jgi:hypothetical protein
MGVDFPAMSRGTLLDGRTLKKRFLGGFRSKAGSFPQPTETARCFGNFAIRASFVSASC